MSPVSLPSWPSNPIADPLPGVIRTADRVLASENVTETSFRAFQRALLTCVAFYRQVISETLQSFRGDPLTLLTFTANENDSLIGHDKASGAPTLTSARVYKPFVESQQLFYDSVARCSSRLD